eukprot:981751_1
MSSIRIGTCLTTTTTTEPGAHAMSHIISDTIKKHGMWCMMWHIMGASCDGLCGAPIPPNGVIDYDMVRSTPLRRQGVQKHSVQEVQGYSVQEVQGYSVRVNVANVRYSSS